jgi:hypothetical protein
MYDSQQMRELTPFSKTFPWVRLIWFCSRAIALTYQEHCGVTYLTLSEDPSPRVIFHNRCPVTLLIKENIKGIVDSTNYNVNNVKFTFLI